MSFYYKQNFVSPQPIFALVKEELRGYMETGAVDDTLFSTWTDQCLKKLGKAAYPINQAMLCINDCDSVLPDDFHAAREVWSCSEWSRKYQEPNATYTQISTRIDTPDLYCNLNCNVPDQIQAVYKTTNTVAFTWHRTHLLTPGNHYPACPDDLYCVNRGAISPDSYDIRDNKIATSFREGKIYMQYYSKQFDGENQLVPDNYYTAKFIELFIKQKLFEQMYNQVTDDTMAAMEKKYREYKQQADEAYILADTDNKKEDVYRKERAIGRTRRRFRKYEIR